ncbi:helix-turn-helix domain-containing protein [Phyllobacterium sp. YR531]|uniref:winged helix-turn-helix transcriptional regulator n=1 Tax=Phyllobacterium sp. YR531 TaxID=1144343 RepID=UPI00026F7E81|nr:helix-turn-helix domain-containing protein [Phyllobacterium sp. YR531]EJN02106.1 putative transcriptional regulator [Phyllobacterium sp. YR531]
MEIDKRSGCPINLSLEVLGDKWSLIVIRDMMFGNRRHFRDLLTHSEERIASNILAARLKHLLSIGLITKRDDPSHSQKAIYSLTEPSIQLLPILAMIGGWGRKHLPVTPELSIRAELLEDGGPIMWEEFMNELREIHITNPIGGTNGQVASSVLARLTAAYIQTCERMEES